MKPQPWVVGGQVIEHLTCARGVLFEAIVCAALAIFSCVKEEAQQRRPDSFVMGARGRRGCRTALVATELKDPPGLHDALRGPHDLGENHSSRPGDKCCFTVRLRAIREVDTPSAAREPFQSHARVVVFEKVVSLVSNHETERRDVRRQSDELALGDAHGERHVKRSMKHESASQHRRSRVLSEPHAEPVHGTQKK